MSRDISLTAKQALFDQETDEVFVVLLTIDHPDLSEPIRVSSEGVNTVSRGPATTADLTANGNTGTLGGNAEWFRGILGTSALQFDNSSYVDFGTSTAFDLSVFSLEFWIEMNAFNGSTGGNNIIFGRENYTVSGFRAGVGSDGSIIFWSGESGGTFYITAPAGTLAIGQKAFVALVYDGTDAHIYVDGVEKASGTGTYVVPTGRSLVCNAGIGGTTPSQSKRDDVRLWNFARSGAQMQADMNTELAGTESGLVGYWPMNEGTQFIACPFDITLPDETEDRGPRAHLAIDNVTRDIVQAVRTIDTAPTVKIEIVRGANPGTVEVAFPDFKLSNITYDALTVEGDLTLDNFLAEPFPAARFDPARFPGLF